MRGKLCASLHSAGLDSVPTTVKQCGVWLRADKHSLESYFMLYTYNTKVTQRGIKLFCGCGISPRIWGPCVVFFSRFLLKTPYWLTQRSVEVFELKIWKFAETNLRVHCVINCSRLLTCLRSDKKVCIMKAVSSLSLSTTPKILVSWHFLSSPPPPSLLEVVSLSPSHARRQNGFQLGRKRDQFLLFNHFSHPPPHPLQG